MLSDFLVGASAALLSVALMAAIMWLAGATGLERLPWFLFGLAALLLVVAYVVPSLFFFGAGAGAIAATAAFMVWADRRSRREDEAARTLAEDLGLTYEHESSSPELRDLAGLLTSPGDRNRVRRVLSGRWRGADVCLFDYSWEMSGEEGALSRGRFSCAVVGVPFDNGPILIIPKTPLTRLIGKPGVPAVQLGDVDLDRLFKVYSTSTAVREIVGPRARGWLTENGRGLHFLIGSGRVLCAAKPGKLAREELLDLVWTFRGQLTPSESADRTAQT